MAMMTRYGSFWGMIPQTSGRYFWVAPSAGYTVEGAAYEASDNNDGLSPERALLTIDRAVNLTTASVGDVIVLLPGSHSVSATVAVDVAGITIVGIPGSGPMEKLRMSSGSVRNRSQVTSTETAGMIFTVTAADVEIAWLHLTPITAGAGISASNAADRLYVHDCTFNLGSTTQTATFGITFPLGTGTATHNDDTLISNCYFQAGANVGPFIRAAGTCDGLTIQSSTFELIGAAAMDDAIELTQINLGTHIRDCDFFTPTSATTVFTDCIDVTGGTTDGSTQVYRCYFPEGSDAFEATATIDITAAENYLSTATGGALAASA
jgi:hypothetical protein